jgi:hypothetical protein
MPHDRLENRSLALHRAIAAKLRQHPKMLAIAGKNLNRWEEMGSRSQPYWDVWRNILARPLEEILTVIVQDTPRMAELRQSSPFAGILEPKERWHIYGEFWLRSGWRGGGAGRMRQSRGCKIVNYTDRFWG